MRSEVDDGVQMQLVISGGRKKQNLKIDADLVRKTNSRRADPTAPSPSGKKCRTECGDGWKYHAGQSEDQDVISETKNMDSARTCGNSRARRAPNANPGRRARDRHGRVSGITPPVKTSVVGPRRRSSSCNTGSFTVLRIGRKAKRRNNPTAAGAASRETSIPRAGAQHLACSTRSHLSFSSTCSSSSSRFSMINSNMLDYTPATSSTPRRSLARTSSRASSSMFSRNKRKVRWSCCAAAATVYHAALSCSCVLILVVFLSDLQLLFPAGLFEDHDHLHGHGLSSVVQQSSLSTSSLFFHEERSSTPASTSTQELLQQSFPAPLEEQKHHYRGGRGPVFFVSAFSPATTSTLPTLKAIKRDVGTRRSLTRERKLRASATTRKTEQGTKTGKETSASTLQSGTTGDTAAPRLQLSEVAISAEEGTSKSTDKRLTAPAPEEQQRREQDLARGELEELPLQPLVPQQRAENDQERPLPRSKKQRRKKKIIKTTTGTNQQLRFQLLDVDGPRNKDQEKAASSTSATKMTSDASVEKAAAASSDEIEATKMPSTTSGDEAPGRSATATLTESFRKGKKSTDKNTKHDNEQDKKARPQQVEARSESRMRKQQMTRRC
ncbi:unnamed protein product [Amoebophrya sp. A120]|nr:unnamed protein product [Amoebophrya sp. A120]|eukprot:GSA120T00016323001.1